MDHVFFRNAGPAAREASRLDYCVMVATLQAMQLATPTARAEARCGGGGDEPASGQRAPLAEILIGGQHWQEAVVSQGGSFNPLVARGCDAW